MPFQQGQPFRSLGRLGKILKMEGCQRGSYPDEVPAIRKLLGPFVCHHQPVLTFLGTVDAVGAGGQQPGKRTVLLLKLVEELPKAQGHGPTRRHLALARRVDDLERALVDAVPVLTDGGPRRTSLSGSRAGQGRAAGDGHDGEPAARPWHAARSRDSQAIGPPRAPRAPLMCEEPTGRGRGWSSSHF